MITPLHQVASLVPRVRASPYTIAVAEALDIWASKKKRIILSETLHTDRISDLYVTLPTRDGTRHPYKSPKNSEALGFGHHLAFFHPRTPEKYLRSDGTDADFCPPEPFVRRMWAGGRMEWRRPLIIGGKATACMDVRSVVKKGFGDPVPMVFVNQGIEISNEGDDEYAILEERTHVYLALGVNQRKFRQGTSTGASSPLTRQTLYTQCLICLDLIFHSNSRPAPPPCSGSLH
jgi:hydroxyacyl-ACP dehydratase HTD2-like protein with hotdog domain